MTAEEFYTISGGDYKTIFLRFQDDGMILRFLTIFLRDTSFSDLEKAMETKDEKAAFLAAHNLKGASLSLELGDLSRAAIAMTESVRNGWTDEAEPSFETLKRVYHKTIEAIHMIEGLA